MELTYSSSVIGPWLSASWKRLAQVLFLAHRVTQTARSHFSFLTACFVFSSIEARKRLDLCPTTTEPLVYRVMERLI
jgi:hypothetical protein